MVKHGNNSRKNNTSTQNTEMKKKILKYAPKNTGQLINDKIIIIIIIIIIIRGIKLPNNNNNNINDEDDDDKIIPLEKMNLDIKNKT